MAGVNTEVPVLQQTPARRILWQPERFLRSVDANALLLLSILPRLPRLARRQPRRRRISARTGGRFIWSPLIEARARAAHPAARRASVPPEELAAPNTSEAETRTRGGARDLARATFSLCTDGRATCSRKAFVQAVRASGLYAGAREVAVEDTLPGGWSSSTSRPSARSCRRRRTRASRRAPPAAMSVRGGLCRVLDDVRRRDPRRRHRARAPRVDVPRGGERA